MSLHGDEHLNSWQMLHGLTGALTEITQSAVLLSSLYEAALPREANRNEFSSSEFNIYKEKLAELTRIASSKRENDALVATKIAPAS
jgi:hypothetical protein